LWRAFGDSIFERQETFALIIHRQLVEVYGEGVMNKGNVRKWSRLFTGGRTDVHNEARSGLPSGINQDLEIRVDAHVRGNKRFTRMQRFGKNTLKKNTTCSIKV
jgi:hypothetical protein